MIRGRRRTIVAGLLLAGLAIGQATLGAPGSSAAGTPVAATPTVAGTGSAATPATNGAAKVATPAVAAAAPATTTTAPATRGGTDAPLLRFGLILMLGLALGGGAVVQFRATVDAPPYVPKPRRPRRTAPAIDTAPAPEQAKQTPPTATPAATMPTAQTHAAPSTLERAPVFSAFPRGERLNIVPPPPQRPQPLHVVERAPRLSRAEEACANAIAAAYRYDRPGTLSAFGAALDADPTLKPSALPDFWEMPAGGHADLALAYLQREQRLDARSIVTMALLTFPHHRELTALLREIDPYRLDRPA